MGICGGHCADDNGSQATVVFQVFQGITLDSNNHFVSCTSANFDKLVKASLFSNWGF